MAEDWKFEMSQSCSITSEGQKRKYVSLQTGAGAIWHGLELGLGESSPFNHP